MSNSTLINYTKLSPNHSGKRKYLIDRITPHCIVGQLSVETLGSIFANPNRKASCQYGIGADGRVGLYCDETNRSWCSSSADNDNRAVTIECASDRTHPYTFNNTVYQKLIDLCADICIRNGKSKLLWIPDRATALSYKILDNEMLLTVHRWFANKACPGDWLYARLGEVANKVNERINGVMMEEHWARRYLDNLVKKGLIMSPEAHQNLDATITKGELFAILDRLTDRK